MSVFLPYWRCSVIPSNEGPFNRGRNERSIGVTVHAPTETGSQSDNEALALLRELARLENCSYSDTAVGSDHQLVFDPDERTERGYCLVAVHRPDADPGQTGISHPEQWDRCATNVAAGHKPADPLRRDVFSIAAHQALRHDLFVTNIPWLLEKRNATTFRHYNVCPPQEALGIVSLFLRSRNEFTVSGPPYGIRRYDPHGFYLMATRAKLPRLWQRLEAWEDILRTNHEASMLRGTIITRCRRALIARDAIAFQVYSDSRGRSEEAVLYHFDYLLLLLAGAFDACARLAQVAHDLDIEKIQTSLWRKDFRRVIRTKPVTGLHDCITSARFNRLRILLTGLRNTIHDVALRGMGSQVSHEPPRLLIKIEEKGKELWDAAEEAGGAGRWGLSRLVGHECEPLTYANALVDECFELIAQTIDAMEPENTLAPTAPATGTGRREVFPPEVIRRVALMV